MGSTAGGAGMGVLFSSVVLCVLKPTLVAQEFRIDSSLGSGQLLHCKSRFLPEDTMRVLGRIIFFRPISQGM